MIIKIKYIPITRVYKSKRGLSEKLIRKRLEKSGWVVWRGGFINAVRKNYLYPNVEKKYKKLNALMDREDLIYLSYMAKIHHGMPDFLCYREGFASDSNGFKFVECKLGYEQLSDRQKTCIAKLLKRGFKVEVHKMVHGSIKLRVCKYNIITGEKKVIAQQKRLVLRW
ncbi:VRR-NUC domain-containing protein [Candidatus Woesearchaeota archaeon]|nr:VRR-NUC domain-containing protein [Candidatus Woesearchaeota archaeon]